MTDEQILKRLAEIEDWYVEEIHGHVRLWVDENFCESGDTYGIVDPLTNWSDLGPLIEKLREQYRIEIDDTHLSLWGFTNPGFEADVHVQETSLERALCLAIIEANGGMGDE